MITIKCVGVVLFASSVLIIGFMVLDHIRHVYMANKQPWSKLWACGEDTDRPKTETCLRYPMTQEQTQERWSRRQPNGKNKF